jgi:hypothetical protein
MSTTEIDIHNTQVLHTTPKWRIATPNVAIATGVTEHGQDVDGIGASNWSADAALDDAVENAKEVAQRTDFGIQVNSVVVASSNVRVDILRNRGEIRTQHNGFSFSVVVEITAAEDDRTVDSRGKSRWRIPGGRDQYQKAYLSAVDSAESQMQRVGRTSLD